MGLFLDVEARVGAADDKGTLADAVPSPGDGQLALAQRALTPQDRENGARSRWKTVFSLKIEAAAGGVAVGDVLLAMGGKAAMSVAEKSVLRANPAGAHPLIGGYSTG